MLLNKTDVNPTTVLTCVAFLYFISLSLGDIKVAQHHNKVSVENASCTEDNNEEDLPKSQSSTAAGKNPTGLRATAFSIDFMGCICLLKIFLYFQISPGWVCETYGAKRHKSSDYRNRWPGQWPWRGPANM